MRYVLIRDDACLADIDEALRTLRARRAATTLDVSKRWIGEDIDELLDMRGERMAEALSA
jgi:hypothetical protein